MNTDQAWEEWGRQNPYFGVLADKKFRSENLTASTKAEFFATGDDHVRHVMDVCRHHFDPDFQPQRILDFGCGTGRLVIPFAKTAAEVVGLDVSDSMLAEARRNCESHGLVNVQLLKSADTIGDSLGEFDLVHSFIVFQHIPVAKGMHILRQVLRRVRQGGFAAIHITYSRKAYRRFVNANPYLPRPFYEWIRGSGRRIERVLRRALRRLPPDPEMQMNIYDANTILFSLQDLGVTNTFVEFTDHGGTLGTMLYFRRP